MQHVVGTIRKARRRRSTILPGPAGGARQAGIQRILRDPALQAKLKVNPPGDSYEREADRIADSVLAGGVHASGISRIGSGHVQRKCDACREEDERLQRKPDNAGGQPQPVAVGVSAASLGSGHALPQAAREYFAPRLGHDLGGVRVHDDHHAHGLAARVRARAFTVGRHIVFGPNEFQPESRAGKLLLAHELVHTIQQSAGGSAGLVQRQPVDEPGEEPQRAGAVTMPEEDPIIEYAANGSSWCDRETGRMRTRINTTACTRPCTEAHEADHRDYREDCCATYAVRRAVAVITGDWQERNAVTRRYNGWVRQTSDFSECRAYGESVACGEQMETDLGCTGSNPADPGCCSTVSSYLSSMRSQQSSRCPGTDKDCPDFDD